MEVDKNDLLNKTMMDYLVQLPSDPLLAAFLDTEAVS